MNKIPTILEEIVYKKKIRLLKEKENRHRFYNALAKRGLSIIGEIKKASPSKGIIKNDFNPIDIAKEYENKVDAISVLTEEEFFMGSPQYLSDISKSISTPLLRKDFIIDSFQIYEAKVLGASCILLIVAILTQKQLEEYLMIADEIGLDALVEIHDRKEMVRAIEAKAKIIGINNRNLHTFNVDLSTTLELSNMVPEGTLLVSESGIFDKKDIEKLKTAKIDGILVGESFMRSSDINKKVEELRNAYNT